ncbi:MAG TPA: hypothetical protein GXX29_12570 [Firmicutes bacterium]|nr:hypothetical protein [Bacillota bacterium]
MKLWPCSDVVASPLTRRRHGTQAWKFISRAGLWALINLLSILIIDTQVRAAEGAVNWYLRAMQAEREAASCFIRTTTLLSPLRIRVVMDSIWNDGRGNWILIRHSDTWDDGLTAVADRLQLTICTPSLPVCLKTPANDYAALVSPFMLPVTPEFYELTLAGDDTVDGRPAVRLENRLKNKIVIKWWIDKETYLLLREERYDYKERLISIVQRESAPHLAMEMAEDPSVAEMLSRETMEEVKTWQYQAIISWLQAQVSYRLPLPLHCDNDLHVEWVDVEIDDGGATVIMMLVNYQDQLTSIWLTPAGYIEPIKRPLFAHGRVITSRRWHDFDIIIISSSERQAERVWHFLTTSAEWP